MSLSVRVERAIVLMVALRRTAEPADRAQWRHHCPWKLGLAPDLALAWSLRQLANWAAAVLFHFLASSLAV